MSLSYGQEKHSRTLSTALQHCNLGSYDIIQALMQVQGLSKSSNENDGLVQRLVYLKQEFDRVVTLFFRHTCGIFW